MAQTGPRYLNICSSRKPPSRNAAPDLLLSLLLVSYYWVVTRSVYCTLNTSPVPSQHLYFVWSQVHTMQENLNNQITWTEQAEGPVIPGGSMSRDVTEQPSCWRLIWADNWVGKVNGTISPSKCTFVQPHRCFVDGFLWGSKAFVENHNLSPV